MGEFCRSFLAFFLCGSRAFLCGRSTWDVSSRRGFEAENERRDEWKADPLSIHLRWVFDHFGWMDFIGPGRLSWIGDFHRVPVCLIDLVGYRCLS